MRTRLFSWLAVIGAVAATACTSTPMAPPETLAPTLVIRTPGSTLWTTAEAEAAAAAAAAAANARAASTRAASTTAANASATARPAAAGAAANSSNGTAQAPGGLQKGVAAGVNAAAAVQQTPGEAANAVGLVYFDFDSFEIRPDFEPLLEIRSRSLLADRKRRLVVEGHADERGGAEYNLALGQKRAEAVVKALRLLGAAEDQIEAVSFGDTRPVSTEKTEAAWAKNRRAEIK